MSDPIDRLLDAAESGKTIIKNRDILQTTYEPDIIQHRTTEQEQVTQSLLPILKQSRPSNLLIYGKPGIGKTLVVKKVISKIQKRAKESKFPIKLVYSNSKDETTLYGLLVSLGRELGLDEKELPTTGLAISEVFKRLLKKIDDGKINAIFVIDEIDYLAQLVAKTGKDILYQLTRANERLKQGSLTLVGISNDLRFKDNLDPRVISSLGEEEIVFTNYDKGQIQNILEDRINKAFVENSVGKAALELCASLAAQEHGDARRAIDLIRVAGEIAEREQSEIVTDKHVRLASQKIEEKKEEISLQSFALHEKLVILAIMKANGSSTGEIYSSYKNLCKVIGHDELTNRRVTQILSDIELSGIITGRLVHQGIHGRTKKYELSVTSGTVKKAFKESKKDASTLKDII